MKEKLYLHSIENFMVENDNIWMIDDSLCCILRYQCSENYLGIVAFYPEEILPIAHPFSYIYKIEDDIFLFPCFAEDIYVYSLSKKTYKSLNVPSEIFRGFQSRKQVTPVWTGNDLYCVIRCPDMLIKIDIMEKNYEIFDVFPETYKLESMRRHGDVRNEFIGCEENKLFIPCRSNVILEYFLTENRVIERPENIEVGENNFIVGYKCMEDNEKLIFSSDGNIYRKSLRESEHYSMKKIVGSRMSLLVYPERWRLVNVIVMDDKLWAICAFDSRIYVIDKKSNTIDFVENKYVYQEEGIQREIYTCAAKLNENEIVIAHYLHSEIFILDVHTRIIRREKIFLEAEDDNVQRLMELSFSYPPARMDWMMLLLNYVVQNETSEKKCSKEKNAGRAIYKTALMN